MEPNRNALTATQLQVAGSIGVNDAYTTRPRLASVLRAGDQRKSAEAISALLDDLNTMGFATTKPGQNAPFIGLMCHREFRADQDV